MPITDTSTLLPPTGHESWLTGLETDQPDADIAAALAALGEPTGIALRQTTSWETGAYVESGENKETNEYAHEELEAGAEALLFRLYQQPDVEDIAAILKDIPLADISLHCSLRYPGQDPAELFRDLVRYLRKEGHDLATISGSVDFDPLLDWSEPPFPPLVRLLYFVSRWMPEFRVLQVNAAGFNNGIGEADSELALAIAKGAEYLKQVQEKNYSIALANRHLKFAFTVGTSFHGDVAKLRAFRILWAKVLESLGIDNPPAAHISAHTDITTIQQDKAENKVALQLQTRAASLGGADLLFLAPAEGMHQAATDSGRLLSRQVLMEARNANAPGTLVKVDEAYLEDLTVGLVKAAWLRYKHIEDQGGFANAVEL
jgi:methylmalonyl-CoA mutase